MNIYEKVCLELKNKELDYEKCYLFSYGNIVANIVGNSDEVNLKEYEKELIEGISCIIHNHPNGRLHSPQDIWFQMIWDIRLSYVVGDDVWLCEWYGYNGDVEVIGNFIEEKYYELMPKYCDMYSDIYRLFGNDTEKVLYMKHILEIIKLVNKKFGRVLDIKKVLL